MLINNLADAEASKNLIKYFQEENQRARDHDKELMTMQLDMFKYMAQASFQNMSAPWHNIYQ